MTDNPDLTAALEFFAAAQHDAIRTTCDTIAGALRILADHYAQRMAADSITDPDIATALEVGLATLDAAIGVVRSAEGALT